MFEKVEKAKQFLLELPQCNGKIGVIGFCFGGGFAVILSAGDAYNAASINYGALPKDAETLLQNACPIVASYGKLDRGLKGTATRLDNILSKYGIPHDVKEYPETDHAFMNDHNPASVPLFIKIFSYVFGGGGYHEESTMNSRQRIISFFDQHLK